MSNLLCAITVVIFLSTLAVRVRAEPGHIYAGIGTGINTSFTRGASAWKGSDTPAAKLSLMYIKPLKKRLLFIAEISHFSQWMASSDEENALDHVGVSLMIRLK